MDLKGVNHRIMWDFLVVNFMICVVVIPLGLLAISCYKKEAAPVLLLRFFYFIAGVLVSVCDYFFVYNGNLALPNNIWQGLKLILIFMVSFLSIIQLLIPYYQKKPWKHRIVYLALGFTISIFAYLFLYNGSY